MTTATTPKVTALGSLSAKKRLKRAAELRSEVAKEKKAQGYAMHQSNGDDDLYADRNFFASFTKGLPHHETDDRNTPCRYYEGEVVESAYQKLLGALISGESDDYAKIPLGVENAAAPVQASMRFSSASLIPQKAPPEGKETPRSLVNPQAALAYDLQGYDAQQLTIPPAPAFSSAEAAGEMLELYWMALTRDVPFSEYGSNPLIDQAIAELNKFAQENLPANGTPNFTWPLNSTGEVDAQNLFRGNSAGENIGPYISQFLLLDVPFGAQVINQRMNTVGKGTDYMTTWDEWLKIQRGVTPTEETIDPIRRYIRNGRDLSQYVHVDVLFQAYFNAMLLLVHPTKGYNNYLGLEARFDPKHPYNFISNQEGFGTLGGPHIATILCEVATRALKAVWFQKWNVHRRLRPEVFAGRVHRVKHEPMLHARYDFHNWLLQADVLEAVADHNRQKNGPKSDPSYLLPMAFPEGSPLHPAYGAGHATVAGACVTVLKAFFDETQSMSDLTVGIDDKCELLKFVPKIPKLNSDKDELDGIELEDYTGKDIPQMTVGSELNKLAANIGIGRNIAGVHWRSDHEESIRLGEEIAIGVLEDQRYTYNEKDFELSFTRFAPDPVTGNPVKYTIQHHKYRP